MKQKNYDDRKRKIVYTSLIFFCLFLLMVIVATLLLRNNSDKSKPNSNGTSGPNLPYLPPTEEEKKQVQDTKTATRAPDVSTPTAPTSNVGDVTIISAEQNVNKDLVVKTQLNGDQWASCTLSVQNGGKTITRDAKALYQPTFSTCMGFV
ncbi:hypothetical protein KC976_03330, partial [Candidatus Saccharibacteria bacterium]|nr:hypothetical protein [Candidatus Saccharibacteria bacterium]